MLAAAIDAGTNTFRLLIAEPVVGARVPWRDLVREQRIVRLGEGLRATRRLQPAPMERALDALRHFAALLHRHRVPPARCVAVATAAVREASNGQAFLARVREETGIALRPISGEEEARLSLRGAYAALDAGIAQPWLLADIGGGSTELVCARNDCVLDAASLPIGVVRLTEACLRHDPPRGQELDRLRREVEAAIAPLWRRWEQKGVLPQALVATAGTPTTLAAYALDLSHYDPARVQGFFFSPSAWRKLRDELLAKPAAERAQHPMIPPRRADVLAAGIVILDALQSRFGGFYVSDAGLLEGLWLAASGKSTGVRS